MLILTLNNEGGLIYCEIEGEFQPPGYCRIYPDCRGCRTLYSALLTDLFGKITWLCTEYGTIF